MEPNLEWFNKHVWRLINQEFYGIFTIFLITKCSYETWFFFLSWFYSFTFIIKNVECKRREKSSFFFLFLLFFFFRSRQIKIFLFQILIYALFNTREKWKVVLFFFGCVDSTQSCSFSSVSDGMSQLVSHFLWLY